MAKHTHNSRHVSTANYKSFDCLSVTVSLPFRLSKPTLCLRLHCRENCLTAVTVGIDVSFMQHLKPAKDKTVGMAKRTHNSRHIATANYKSFDCLSVTVSLPYSVARSISIIVTPFCIFLPFSSTHKSALYSTLSDKPNHFVKNHSLSK